MQQILCFTNEKKSVDVFTIFLEGYKKEENNQESVSLVLYPGSEISANLNVISNSKELFDLIFESIYLGYEPIASFQKETMDAAIIISEYQRNELFNKKENEFAVFVHGSVKDAEGSLNYFSMHYSADVITKEQGIEIKNEKD